MDDRIRRLAERMGAKIVAELPDVADGALGAAHYAAFYRKRMEEVRRQLCAEGPSGEQLLVPMNEATLRALEAIPGLLWPEQKVSAAQFASGLLKGMSLLILDHLIKQVESDRDAAKKTVDAKAALLAAMQEMLEQSDRRQAAG